MLRSAFGRWIAVLLTGFLAVPGSAQTAKETFSIQAATAKDASADIIATSRSIRFTFIVTNKSEGAISLSLTPEKIARGAAKGCGKPVDCNLKWEINGAALMGTLPSFKLARGAEAELTLVGDLPELDSYFASILIDRNPRPQRCAQRICRGLSNDVRPGGARR